MQPRRTELLEYGQCAGHIDAVLTSVERTRFSLRIGATRHATAAGYFIPSNIHACILVPLGTVCRSHWRLLAAIGTDSTAAYRNNEFIDREYRERKPVYTQSSPNLRWEVSIQGSGFAPENGRALRGARSGEEILHQPRRTNGDSFSRDNRSLPTCMFSEPKPFPQGRAASKCVGPVGVRGAQRRSRRFVRLLRRVSSVGLAARPPRTPKESALPE